MKMIWAVFRPEFAQRVIEALDYAGIGAMTRLQVTGSGSDRNTPPMFLSPADSSREVLIIAVPDHEVAKAVTVIRAHARLEDPARDFAEGDGSGKIFVTYIDESFTIRTAGKMRAP
jgi:nitrogen regulatory protein PII 1